MSIAENLVSLQGQKAQEQALIREKIATLILKVTKEVPHIPHKTAEGPICCGMQG